MLVTNLTASGDVAVGDDLTVTGDLTVATKQAPATATIALAASTTTDGMNITVTMKDAGGTTVAGVYIFDLWMSEAATGIGLTGDTYSGDLTASTGTILGALTAKKAWRVQTAASGIFVATLVASANPTDQYAAVSLPLTGNVIVSSASGTNWEGAT
jgi:hypothetical protein